MVIATIASSWLQQTAQFPDTIVAKTLPAQRSFFDYTSGTLQIIVLLLAIVVLLALAFMLVSTKRGLDSLRETVEKLYNDSKPIVQQATRVAEDAREVIAMLRTDVVRITDAASALSDQLLDAAQTTEKRIDEVNAVLDVVQGELEDTAISAAAALRGVRVGSRELTRVLGTGKRRKKRRDRDGGSSRDVRDSRDEHEGAHAAD